MHVSGSCCNCVLLAQDKFDDSKQSQIYVIVANFIISNVLLDSHIRIINVKLFIMLVFLWPCLKRANVMAYLSADVENKFSSSRWWLHFDIAWRQKHSGCLVCFIGNMP